MSGGQPHAVVRVKVEPSIQRESHVILAVAPKGLCFGARNLWRGRQGWRFNLECAAAFPFVRCFFAVHGHDLDPCILPSETDASILPNYTKLYDRAVAAFEDDLQSPLPT